MELFLSNLVKRSRSHPVKQYAELGSIVHLLCTSSSPVEFWLHATGNMPPNANVTLDTTSHIHTLSIYLLKEYNYGKYICRGQDSTDDKYVYFISESTVARAGINNLELHTMLYFLYLFI